MKWIYFGLAIILFILSISTMILSNPHVQANIINHSQQHVITKLNAEQIKHNQQRNANFNAVNTKEANTQTVIVNQLQHKNIPIIGMMSIPQIGMQNPIINGYGKNGNYLAIGACTMKPNEQMGKGNYALAGHYMDSDTIFHDLHKVRRGMKIYISDMKHIYVYQVNNINTINKYDIDVINDVSNKNIITLLTCMGAQETPYRTLVQGDLINELPATHSNMKNAKLN